VTDINRGDGQWTLDLHNQLTGEASTVEARAIVNASGPWVEKTLNLDEDHDSRHGVRLVKGSHVVVKKLFDHPYTYIFQNADDRILFAVPYENDFTLLGTTDVEIQAEPGSEQIEDAEIDYICRNASEYFETPIVKDQIVWTYTGVRPLYDDASDNASKVTRDYKLDLDTRKGAPILSVYGGKITTYRKLAEQAVDMLKPSLGIEKNAWTSPVPLPGGDIVNADYESFLEQSRQRYPWLDQILLNDYCRNYGTRISALLAQCNAMDELGHHFGGPLYAAEVNYLVVNEWARSAADILWRRSKKGLHVPDGTEAQLQQWIENTYDFTGREPILRKVA